MSGLKDKIPSLWSRRFLNESLLVTFYFSENSSGLDELAFTSESTVMSYSLKKTKQQTLAVV